MNQDAVRIPVGEWAKTRLQKLGENDESRHNSVNNSGFGRNISRWLGKETVLPTNVLTLPLVGINKGHPGVFPVELPAFFIKLFSRPYSLVVDPFGGSGTTGIAALFLHNRDCIVIDNNQEYCQLAYENIRKYSTPLIEDVVLILDPSQQMGIKDEKGFQHAPEKILFERHHHSASSHTIIRFESKAEPKKNRPERIQAGQKTGCTVSSPPVLRFTGSSLSGSASPVTLSTSPAESAGAPGAWRRPRPRPRR